MASVDRFGAWGLAAVTCQLFRVSIDAIQKASQSTSKDFLETHHSAALAASVQDGAADEQTPLVEGSSPTPLRGVDRRHPLWQLIPSHLKAAVWSFRVQVLWCLILIIDITLTFTAVGEKQSRVLPSYVSWASLVLIAFGAWLTVRDLERRRLGYVTRVAYLMAALLLWLPLCVAYSKERQQSNMDDEIVVNITGLYFLLAVMEVCFLDFPSGTASPESHPRKAGGPPKKKTLSGSAIRTLLRPYFWPDETADSATVNRLRAILTWVCVILSKMCNLLAPMAIGRASTALAHQDYSSTIIYSIIYAAIQLMGSTFSEGQSLIYLKVAQAAFVQLSETTFAHLHGLSLDWHLRKKLGEVIRSLDRGIAACDTLMKYLFLWMVPAMAECLTVCIIFATYFDYVPLAVSVFYFVWLYIVWTIIVTLWRKKFRKAVAQSDNEWHDCCTDSLLNFETVKYFTAEDYESRRFGAAVRRYQAGSVAVQASLSFLNVSQKIILQLCLATALSLSVMGIQKRSACCLADGCESAISDCCRESNCAGMQVGDFVAVLAYVAQLFAPLNFLGSVYNAVVMAMIDLTNLSELLAEEPDVKDAPDAVLLPSTNKDDPDTVVEFDNVYFHYPSQPSNKGLKGLSFKMKRGTTTAIVGATGEGKTTVSRLLYRFYDVLGGAVKINGVDVRMVQQRSLRGAIGAVAQQSGLFSDTIRANIRYGRRDATDAEMEQAAKDAQFLSFIESLDEGWDSMVGDRGLKLSGGERQRASIARCLLKDPPIVLLDEATSALDTLTENSVQEALDRLGSERTVLVIAHRLGTIRNADNIIVLKNGVAEEQGTHDQLLELNGIYAEMWTIQLRSNKDSQVSLTALTDT